MQIHIYTYQNTPLAEIDSDIILIHDAQEALELIANCGYQGATHLILQSHHFDPGFFDLKTGLAGEVLQKFSTYNAHLAIIGDHSQYTSKALNDFIRESNRQRRIYFVASLEEAREALSA